MNKRMHYVLLIVLLCGCNPYSLPEKRSVSKETALAYYQEGVNAYSEGLFEESLEWVDKAISLNSNFAQFHQLKGNVLREMKNYTSAIESYQTATTIRSNLPEVYQSMGEIYFIEARYDEAVRSFKKILASDEMRLEIYLEIAACYIAMEEYQLALNNVRDYVRLAKSSNVTPDERHLFLRGKILFLIKNYTQAIESLQLYDRQIRTDQEAIQLLGESYYAEKNYEAGLSYFNRLITLEPDEGLWYFKRGIYFFEKEDYLDAKSQFSHALDLNENLSDAHYYLGKINEVLGNTEEALEEYNKFLNSTNNSQQFPDVPERIEYLQQISDQ